MAKTTTRAAAQGGRPLPRLTVARFREVGLLVEQLVDEQTDAFIQAGQAFRDKHRVGTSRPLDAMEVAQIAAGLSTSLADAREQIEAAGLTHYDAPAQQEYLVAAGVATAPAFINAALRVVALLELDDDEFEAARESERLQDALAEAMGELEQLDLDDARIRAARAFEHLASKAGVDQGKPFSLIARTVWQGLQQAMRHLTTMEAGTSLMSSSTPSPASTAGGDATFSTTSAGRSPSA